MILVFYVNQEPPAKADWQDPDPNKRVIWNQVAEAITSWFCHSNGLRKDHDVILDFEEFSLKLEGQSIRYLAPSIRSALSLIYKAYTLAIKTRRRVIESSPGIAIHPPSDLSKLPRPWYEFSYHSDGTMSKQIREGTIFANWKREPILPIEVPTGNLNDSILWFHYAINGELYV